MGFSISKDNKAFLINHGGDSYSAYAIDDSMVTRTAFQEPKPAGTDGYEAISPDELVERLEKVLPWVAMSQVRKLAHIVKMNMHRKQGVIQKQPTDTTKLINQ